MRLKSSHRIFRGGCLAVAISGLALLPSSAALGACTWNVAGSWVIGQANNIRVNIDLKQTGSTLLGTAFYGFDGVSDGRRVARTHGNVTGTINGNELRLRISWTVPVGAKLSIGEYSATMSGAGVLTGVTRDVQLGRSAPVVRWQSHGGNFRCS